jgi:hypothetical protein
MMLSSIQSGVAKAMVASPRFAATDKSREALIKESQEKTAKVWDRVTEALAQSGLLNKADLPGKTDGVLAQELGALGMIVIYGDGTPDKEKALNDVIKNVPGLKQVGPGQYEDGDVAVFVQRENRKMYIA